MERSENGIVIPTHSATAGRPVTSSMVAWVGRHGRLLVRLAVAAAALGAAFHFGWDWLAAAGVTGFLIGLLPCAVMCATGLCASRLLGSKGSCSAAPGSPVPPARAESVPAEGLPASSYPPVADRS